MPAWSGAVAEFDKAMTGAKLRGAGDRIRRERGKCEGRKTLTERRPEVVALAKRLRWASPKTGKRVSLREIAAELEKAGYLRIGHRVLLQAKVPCAWVRRPAHGEVLGHARDASLAGQCRKLKRQPASALFWTSTGALRLARAVRRPSQPERATCPSPRARPGQWQPARQS